MLNCIRIYKEASKNKINNKTALVNEILFEVRGLEAVLSTLLSKLISTISLIIQPALLIKKAPIKKYRYHLINSNV